jgi:hypothetical protein
MNRRPATETPNTAVIIVMFGLGLAAFATIAFVSGSTSLVGRVYNAMLRRRPVAI